MENDNKLRGISTVSRAEFATIFWERVEEAAQQETSAEKAKEYNRRNRRRIVMR